MEREIYDRSYRFGRDVMRYVMAVGSTGLERDLLRQLFRSATSVGANLQEARVAASRRDFVYKVALARKEAFEARHWLRLRQDMRPTDPAVPRLHDDADALCRTLTAILLSAKRNDRRAHGQ